jgi:hypothetical protein
VRVPPAAHRSTATMESSPSVLLADFGDSVASRRKNHPNPTADVLASVCSSDYAWKSR